MMDPYIADADEMVRSLMAHQSSDTVSIVRAQSNTGHIAAYEYTEQYSVENTEGCRRLANVQLDDT